jgi:hypothetical protein
LVTRACRRQPSSIKLKVSQMKRITLALALGIVWRIAMADPLSDANSLFEKKNYPQALKAYTVLANAGNAEAQQHLAEMYWYGEAGVIDDAAAEGWFRKSAAKGNKVSADALEVMRKRAARKADIEYWTSKYDGTPLKSGAYRCASPRLPAVSKDNAEIEALSNRIEVWQNCYNGFVAHLNAVSPLVSQIPKDVLGLMKQEELDKSRAHMAEVEAALAAQAKVDSKLVIADIDAWRSATNAWVNEHNEIVKSGPTAGKQAEYEARKRNYGPPPK